MKHLFKSLLLLAGSSLILAGCAKEAFSDNTVAGGGEETVTFNVAMTEASTKAVADGDGAAASVNRCIMEVYYGDALFTRMYAPVISKQASFTASLVSNRTYKVAFWADCVDNASTEAGLIADKYYITNAEGGLKAVAIKGTYAGNADARDAFAFCGEYTVAQGGSSFTAVLKRPFAQINVITNDVAIVKKASGLVPDQVDVTIKNAATKYNVLDSTAVAGVTADLNYQAALYNWDESKSECTLSMDYIFAETEKAVIDINWNAIKTGNTDVAHSFASVPYQRNYRTNIKGALLTTTGQWNVTVDPIWAGEKNHPVVIATTLEQAQAAVGPATTSTEAAGTVIVKEEAVTNRDQSKDKTAAQVAASTPGVTLPDGAKAIEFVLTPQSKEDVIFELPALPSSDYYWYIRHEENYPTKNLSVKVSTNDATRVIIDAPDDTHVELNDVEYTHVIAITGDNTLVVPAGITIEKLTVKKGGVEIHGTVNSLEVLPETGATVKFRDCENLIPEVYNVAKDYIDAPEYCGVANGTNYDIVKSSCKIDEVGYSSLSAALATIPSGNLNLITIELLKDCVLNSNITIGKKNVAIEGNGFSIKASDESTLSTWEDILVRLDGAEKVTFTNVIFDGNQKNIGLVGNGRDIRYVSCSFINAANAQYYGACSGTLDYIGCTINTSVYAINQSENNATVTIEDCNIKGWNSFGSTEIVTISGSTFGKSGYGALRLYNNATIEGCTFTDDFEFIDGGSIETAHTILINSCSDNTASKIDLSDCPNTIFAIDALVTSEGKFKTGTYVGKESIIESKLEDGYIMTQSGTNTYVVSKVDGVAKVGDKYYKTISEACAAVTKNSPMVWVDESAWAADKQAYFGGQFFSYLKDAIVEANTADDATIYVRPNYEGLTTIAHDNIKTNITIYGNNAKLNTMWEPCVENVGGEFHILTKDITFAIYNLHNGAAAWGVRQKNDWVVNVIMENCLNAHEVMINGASAQAGSLTNVTMKNCTFVNGDGYCANLAVATTTSGTIVIDSCSFTGFTSDFAININNKNGGDIISSVSNCQFINCGNTGKNVLRFCGEVESNQSVDLNNLTFTNCYADIANVLLGKNTIDENNCVVSYSIKNTACSYQVLTVGTTDTKVSGNITSSQTVTGDNK